MDDINKDSKPLSDNLKTSHPNKEVEEVLKELKERAKELEELQAWYQRLHDQSKNNLDD